MSLLQPLALVFLAALPAILIFYILRARHQRQAWPTTRFWRELPSDLEGRPTWRIPLWNVLLLLQLLIALLVALALVRPVLLGEERRHVIVLLDASASMQSTDVAPSRFEEARHQVRTLVEGLAEGNEVSLIRIGRRPEILASGDDRGALLAALQATTPTSGMVDYVGALALGNSIAERRHDWRNEFVVVSDGAFPETALASLSGMPYPVQFVRVGQSDNNQAVAELSVRPSLGAAGRYVGFVRLVSYADHPVSVPFRALADGLPIDARVIELPPRGAKELALALPQGTRMLDVAVLANDILRIDNQAMVTVGNERVRQVQVVTNNPALWEKALAAVPLVEWRVVRTSQYRPQPADITIFDGFLPRELPPGNLLVVNPPAGHPLIEVVGETGPVQAIRANNAHPLLDGADLTALFVNKTKQVRPPVWADPLLESGQWPLILAGQESGRRVVVFAFDPATSELPQRIAFPVVMSNTLGWLTPEGFATEVAPGTVLDLEPVPESREIIVRLPNGTAQVIPVSGQPIRFDATDQVGRYTVIHSNGTNPLTQQTFIVNAIDEVESDVRPRDHQVQTAVGTGTAEAVAPGIAHDLWPILAALALAVLTFEWWYYCRRWAT